MPKSLELIEAKRKAIKDYEREIDNLWGYGSPVRPFHIDTCLYAGAQTDVNQLLRRALSGSVGLNKRLRVNCKVNIPKTFFFLVMEPEFGRPVKYYYRHKGAQGKPTLVATYEPLLVELQDEQCPFCDAFWPIKWPNDGTYNDDPAKGDLNGGVLGPLDDGLKISYNTNTMECTIQIRYQCYMWVKNPNGEAHLKSL